VTKKSTTLSAVKPAQTNPQLDDNSVNQWKCFYWEVEVLDWNALAPRLQAFALEISLAAWARDRLKGFDLAAACRPHRSTGSSRRRHTATQPMN
jgi:hypothetical protein